MLKIISYTNKYVRNKLLNDLRYPVNINFPITDNCNSKCVMCDVWKEKSDKDISPIQIRTIFDNKLFKKVKHIGLSGGEPTLRKDLVEIVDILLETLPKLKTISITSHGYHNEIWNSIIGKLKSLTNQHSVELKINVSIDGDKTLHNINRGTKSAFKKATKTIETLKQNGIQAQIQHTVTPVNFNGLNSSLKSIKGLSNDFVLRRSVEVARLDNKNTIKELGAYDRLNSVFSDFILNSKLLSLTANPARRLFYKDLAKRLSRGSSRKAPCYYQNEGLVVTATGELYHCSISENSIGNALSEDAHKLYFSEKSKSIRQSLLQNTCPKCLHDQSGAWSPFKLALEILEHKVPRVFQNTKKIKKLFGLTSSYLWSELKYFFRDKNISVSEAYEYATIIGAYGGEHVGDSAILGGVINRINKKYGVHDFLVLSTRPDRTKVWLDGLIFNDGIKVSVAKDEAISTEAIKGKELLVYAGGPIMELYQDLFMHLTTINNFKYRKIPFIIEGCGFGPFNNPFGEFLGKSILTKGDHLTLREKVKYDLDYVLEHDPAFDYIKSTDLATTRIDKSIIDICSQLKLNKSNVIVNLRPLWSKYATNENLNEVSENIINVLSELINTNPDKHFVYIPFNFDHYGFSDMEPAIKLKSKLANKTTNFTIIERELNFKECITVMTSCHLSICMRFHACIFSSSLGIKTIGIDYSSSGKGKVYGLFEQEKIERISSINTINIDELQSFVNS
ncbi:polysaccharide pyruvyl transferase family protein [uncultured Arcticibacterium sp.]|uniref:polysaccharide pyruvyl transferase family protein n=1 Tax=uncultured Arcticibacterium sp. TaxID=2173042 RepID=UPI0030FB7275